MDHAFAFEAGKKKGLINSLGEVIAEPAYDQIGFFHQGHAPVRLNNLYGVISDTGKLRIPIRYDEILLDGEANLLFPVKKNNYWGFCTLDGAEQIPCVFDDATPFHEGVAGVKIEGEAWRYIDEKGIVLFSSSKSNSDEPQVFSCDRMLVEVVKGSEFEDGLYGYCDKSGGLVIESRFPFAADRFYCNRAHVRSGGKFGVIATDGRFVVEPKYARIWAYDQSMAVAMLSESHWAVINDYGKICFDHKGSDLSGPRHGYFRSSLSETKRGVLDLDGAVAVPHGQFQSFFWGDMLVASVRDENNCFGCIDLRSRRQIVDCIYSHQVSFRGEIALVPRTPNSGEKVWNYVNRDGIVVYTFKRA